MIPPGSESDSTDSQTEVPLYGSVFMESSGSTTGETTEEASSSTGADSTGSADSVETGDTTGGNDTFVPIYSAVNTL